MSLRQKQIREILDEDRNINRQIVNSLHKNVKVYSDIKEPQSVNDAVNTDVLLTKIDRLGEELTMVMQNLDENKYDNISFDISKFNTIMRMRTSLLQKNHRAKSFINSKIQSLLPYYNSVIIGLNTAINRSIIKNGYLNFGDDNSYSTNKTSSKSKSTSAKTNFSTAPSSSSFSSSFVIPRFSGREFNTLITEAAMYTLARSIIASESYRPIDLEEVNVEFNKMVKNYPPAVRQHIAANMMQSSSSAYRKQFQQNLGDTVKHMEDELGRKLTKQEELLLSIRVGGFKEYQPALTKDQVEDLKNTSIDEGRYDELTDSSVPYSSDPSVGPQAHSVTSQVGEPPAYDRNNPYRDMVNFDEENTENAYQYEDDRNDPYNNFDEL